MPSSSLSLSLSSPLPTPVQCGPHALASPARATQHTWPVGHSYLRSVRSYLLQGTASRGPQAATARSAQHGLCSLVSRAHDTSQRRTERPDRQIAFSLPGSACGAFSFPLSLSLSDSFSLSLPLSLSVLLSFVTLSLHQFSPLFLPFRSPCSSAAFTRATYHGLGPLACAPVLSLPSDVPAATCQSPSVVCLRRRRGRGEPRDRWCTGIFLRSPRRRWTLFRW